MTGRKRQITRKTYLELEDRMEEIEKILSRTATKADIRRLAEKIDKRADEILEAIACQKKAAHSAED